MNRREQALAIKREEEKLVRGLGLKEATALNMIDMVGIGPFITIPLILAEMGGPQAMLGWILGAVLALSDGLVWAQLGTAMPHAGGTYVFLREAYGPLRWGRLLSFLFIFQMIFRAPMSMASGLIGFSSYAEYLFPSGLSAWSFYTQDWFGSGLNWLAADYPSIVKIWQQRSLDHRLLAAILGILVIFLLYRNITFIGKMAKALWLVVMGTIAWILFAGITNFNAANVLDFPPGAFDWSQMAFWIGLGGASTFAIYDYLGYQNVCYLGGEIKEPERVIPRAIIYSILGIAAIYFVMNIGIISVIPWAETQGNHHVVSTFIEILYGPLAGKIVTGLILVAAFASVWSLMLGYSRIPYAASLDGGFFRIFSRIHPTKKIPHISLLTVGTITVIVSALFKLTDVIKGLMAIRILIEFVAQAIAIFVLTRKGTKFPFKMWFYPLPALASITLWLYLFVTIGSTYIKIGLGVLSLGIVVYMIRAKLLREFPFASDESGESEKEAV